MCAQAVIKSAKFSFKGRNRPVKKFEPTKIIPTIISEKILIRFKSKKVLCPGGFDLKYEIIVRHSTILISMAIMHNEQIITYANISTPFKKLKFISLFCAYYKH